MDTYSLSVVVEGFDMDSEFHNMGLDCLSYEAVVSQTGGVTYIDADIAAASQIDAVLQLISDLKTINVTVLRLDPMLVSISEIAERTSVSRETARLWTTGQRREGFPAHYTTVGSSSLWTWADVASWVAREGIPFDGAIPVGFNIIEAMNGALAHVRASRHDGDWMSPIVAPVAHLQQRRPKLRAGWQSVDERAAG